MKRTNGWLWFRWITASVFLLTYSVACTHMPSGEKAFDSFDSCFAANLGLAAVGGIAVGVLGSQLTDNKKVGAVAGIAVATMIAMTAWRKCGAVYNKSEPVAHSGEPRPQPVATPGTAQNARLNLDRLEVRVDGTENPAAKDIKAQFRHKVEIVRFKASADDKLVLADDKGDALLDKAGKEIPLEDAKKMSRNRLHWVSIAEEGKDDYVENVVIQQGQRSTYRHKLQVPPRAQLALPLPVPMRYTLSIEIDNMKSTRAVDFSILSTGERPKRFGSHVPSGVTKASPASQSGQSSSSSSKASSLPYATKRKIQLFSDTTPARKPVASLKKGTPVRIEERSQVTVNQRQMELVKVVAEDGTSGWMPSSLLSGGQ